MEYHPSSPSFICKRYRYCRWRKCGAGNVKRETSRCSCPEAMYGRAQIFLEYVLLAGVNDGPEQAHMLGLLSQTLPEAMVNLIPWNPVHSPGLDWKAPSPASTAQFQAILANEYRVACTVRQEKGQDIAGACASCSCPAPHLPLCAAPSERLLPCYLPRIAPPSPLYGLFRSSMCEQPTLIQRLHYSVPVPTSLTQRRISICVQYCVE